MSRILIFANGDLPDLDKAHALLREDDFIIGADGGTRHALALGLTPNIIIGDLDSATFDSSTSSEHRLRPLTEKGTQIIRFPKDKNETDLELAIQNALTLNPEEIIILAALGERLDQTLANIALVSNVQRSTSNVRLDDGIEEVFFCHDECTIKGTSGDIISLIPWQGEVIGIITTGLKWTLQNETLYPQKTRGISNEMTSEIATIQIKSGLLLIVHRRTD